MNTRRRLGSKSIPRSFVLNKLVITFLVVYVIVSFVLVLSMGALS